MSKFSLSVHSFTPPTLPKQPANINKEDFKSPLLASRTELTATSPLLFTISLPAARPKNALHPAAHLQVVYTFEGTGDIFVPNLITSKDLVDASTQEEPNLYRVELTGNDVTRAKVADGKTSDADVNVYAWKGEKLLGKWFVGRVEGLGIVGLKSEPLHILRQKTWEALREAEEKK